MVLVNPALDDPGLFKCLEPGRQGIGAHSRKRALQVVKFARALENEVAQDQNGPAITDNIERSGYRTKLRVIDGHQATTFEIVRSARGRGGDVHNLIISTGVDIVISLIVVTIFSISTI